MLDYHPSSAFVRSLAHLVGLSLEASRILHRTYPDNGYLGASLLSACEDISSWLEFPEAHADFPEDPYTDTDTARKLARLRQGLLWDQSYICRTCIREGYADAAYKNARILARLAFGRPLHGDL